MKTLALVTSPDVGEPDLSPLRDAYTVHSTLDMPLEEALDGADAVFLWDVARAPELAAHGDELGRIGWIHIASTGVDQLCTPALARSSILVTNAGGIYDRAIAEYVLTACLCFERRFATLRDQQRAHAWRWLKGSTLEGAHVLIVGPGRIGRACAELLGRVGCSVGALATHARPAREPFAFIGDSGEIERCIGWADHIVITAPLTPATRGMIDRRALAACKPGAHLVNVGRGPIVNTADLIDALQEGRLAGATLDVLEDEPPEDASPLWDLPGVLLTPHIAGDVADFEDRLVEQFIENAIAWSKGEPLSCVVDKQAGY